MNKVITTVVDTVKDVTIAGGSSFAGMSGLEHVRVHQEDDIDIVVKFIVAILAGVITRLVTLLFKKRK